MASLGWVTPTAATEGVTPLFFFLKNLATFFCSSLSLSLSLFIAFTRVSPPPGCHPTPFLPIRPRFSTILCKFAHKLFSFGCYPLEGVTQCGPPPCPLVTPLVVSVILRILQSFSRSAFHSEFNTYLLRILSNADFRGISSTSLGNVRKFSLKFTQRVERARQSTF